jgi:hypothetical protein
MVSYTFKETLDFFSHKLQSVPPTQDLEKKEVAVVIDHVHAVIAQGKREGSLHMKIMVGLFLERPSEEKLLQLATSNFLGINTGGCSLSIQPKRGELTLHCHTTSGTSPQENWEWFHRLLAVAREWNRMLLPWEEFIPLNIPMQEKKDEPNPSLRGSADKI